MGWHENLTRVQIDTEWFNGRLDNCFMPPRIAASHVDSAGIVPGFEPADVRFCVHAMRCTCTTFSAEWLRELELRTLEFMYAVGSKRRPP